MSLIQAIVLGIIQGLTEFVPISSSGHLVVIPRLLGWPDQGLAFDVVLHLGTLVAVIGYFAKDWKKTIQEAVSKKSKLLWYVIFATVPGLVAGYFLENILSTFFREILWVATFFIITALIFLVVEKYTSYKMVEKKKLKEMNWKDAIVVGLAQVASLFPGISRSGITISAGMFRDIKREESARFSFLMASLIILSAGIWDVFKLAWQNRLIHQLPGLILGFVASALVGYFSIKYLMRYLKTKKLNAFAYYLLGAGIILLIVRFYI